MKKIFLISTLIFISLVACKKKSEIVNMVNSYGIKIAEYNCTNQKIRSLDYSSGLKNGAWYKTDEFINLSSDKGEIKREDAPNVIYHLESLCSN